MAKEKLTHKMVTDEIMAILKPKANRANRSPQLAQLMERIKAQKGMNDTNKTP